MVLYSSNDLRWDWLEGDSLSLILIIYFLGLLGSVLDGSFGGFLSIFLFDLTESFNLFFCGVW